MGKIIIALKQLLAALSVKFAFYFIISLFFIWLLKWAEIIKAFSLKYVLVLTIGLLLFSIITKQYMPEKARKK